MKQFLQLSPDRRVVELFKDRPSALYLLWHIAANAKRTENHPDKKLKIGESYISHKMYGVTRQIYRTDVKWLLANQCIHTRLTSGSTAPVTIAKLVRTDIIDINTEIPNHPANHSLTTAQPNPNQTLTTAQPQTYIDNIDNIDKSEQELGFFQKNQTGTKVPDPSFENQSDKGGVLLKKEDQPMVPETASAPYPTIDSGAKELLGYEESFDPTKHPSTKGFQSLPIIVRWWIAKETKTSQNAVDDFHDDILLKHKSGAFTEWEAKHSSLFTLLINKISYAIKKGELPIYNSDNSRDLAFDKLKPPSYFIGHYRQAKQIFEEDPYMGPPRPLPKNLWQ